MTERLSCPACSSQAALELYKIDSFLIRKCVECGSLYVGNIPDRTVLDQIYLKSDYYGMEVEANNRIEKENRRRLSIIKRFAKPRKVLDVGCASGLFLDAAATAGWETFGIELSPRNAEIAASKGHRVFVGSLADFAVNDTRSTYDLISCLDVIEHVERPRQFLQLLSQRLAPDGILVLSTPNYSGIVARILRERDVFMTPPEHLNFFSFPGLLSLAKHAGLSPVHKTTFGTLTRNELEQAIAKHFSFVATPLKPVLRLAIKAGFHTMNILKSGLELEMYFSRAASVVPQ